MSAPWILAKSVWIDDNWVPFMTYIVACYRWAEGHADEIAYHEDKRAKDHLKRLLEEAEELKRILRVP